MDTEQFIALCEVVAAETMGSKPQRAIKDEASVRIKDALTPASGEGVDFKEFKRLRTGFIYLSIIDRSKDYSSYYYILEKVSEHFNGSTSKIADWSSQVWKDVIGYCKSLPEYPRTDAFTNEHLRWKERERARAATRLTHLGAVPTVKGCELVVENTDAVFARIEQLFTEIGGENVLRQLLAELPFRKEIGRFLVPHQGNQPIPQAVELEKPYGYLLNMCLSHFSAKGTNDGIEEKWKELCDLTTDLIVAVYDSQKYDIWEDIIYQPEEVVAMVHKMIFRFNVYTLSQTNISFAPDWCRFLCKRMMVDPRCSYVLKDKLERIRKVMNWAMSESLNHRCVHIRKGSKADGVLRYKSHGLEQYLLVGVDQLNVGFLHPEDYSKVNCMRYPIVETEEEYILLPKPLALWNWYEAVFNVIRAENKDLAREIGITMEAFIRNKMMTHGIVSHTGDYTYNGIAGEVDYLLEATQADAYIESKKKALSLKAQAGDDYYIWGDLYEMIYSQMQCARLENGVRHHGPIQLTDRKTGKTCDYHWKDTYLRDSEEKKGKKEVRKRYVVKATMTMKEYGPMQDKIVLTRIIMSLLGRQLNATFAIGDTVHSANDRQAIQETFDKLNAALADITTYYQSSTEQDPTFFCRFYSMEQVYFLIKEAKGQNHFVKLLGGGFVSAGTENFWNEYLAVGKRYV